MYIKMLPLHGKLLIGSSIVKYDVSQLLHSTTWYYNYSKKISESCKEGSGKQSVPTSKDIITDLVPYTGL